MLAVNVFVKRRFVHGRHPYQTCLVTSTLSSCQQTFTFRAGGEDDVVVMLNGRAQFEFVGTFPVVLAVTKAG